LDEDGAVSVDWVVLTAAIVGLAVVVVTQIANGTLDLADDAQNCLDYDIPTISDDSGLSYIEQLEKIQDWCSDGIH